MAAVCGALFGSYYGFISPDQWNLLLSIQFIAIIIVGGVGTIFGAHPRRAVHRRRAAVIERVQPAASRS